jgi:dTDP-D-glucose 4,6-dehydratase
VRDWLYVVDHCRAIETVIEKGRVGETYLVGGGNEMPNIEVARLICRELGVGESQIEFVKDRPGHDLRYALDCTKIQTELGWRPIYTFETGLRSTIEWYKNNRNWWEPLLEIAKIKNNDSAVMSYNWGLPQEELMDEMNMDTDIRTNGEQKDTAKTKIVLIFGRGQLGTFYKDYYQKKGYRVVQAVRPEVDVRDFKAVKRVVESVRPDFAINCAAMTNIDWCEQNKLEAFDVNTLGADNIARACQETNTYLVHISSGCVQESKTPDDVKTEDDPVSPLCYYSWTKVWAENLIMDRVKKNRLWALILRPRQLLSGMVSPRNALTKMLTYTKFVDTPNSCTVVEDLLAVTDELIERNVGGLYNVVNPGVTSPYRIALMLKEIIKPDMQFVKISKEELDKMTLAKRVDAVLSMGKLNSLGITLPPLHQRLPNIMRNLKVNLESGEAEQVMAKVSQETQTKLSLVK